jgi:hypothetical protein
MYNGLVVNDLLEMYGGPILNYLLSMDGVFVVDLFVKHDFRELNKSKKYA